MTTNVLLDRLKLPGEVVRLPSCGLFYADGVLADDVVDGEVMVYPMSAYDDISMKNISEIINGKAINIVFARCIPQILRPDELFGKDVDMLLIMLRKVSTGPTIRISYTHNCAEGKAHKYTIPLAHIIASSKTIDPTLVDTDYTVALDNGQIVTLQPIKFKDVLAIMKDATEYESMSNLEIKTKMLESTVRMIKSVDEVTDFDLINEWVHALPKNDFTKITDAMNNGKDWGPNMRYPIICEDCEKEAEVEVPLNPLTFFLDS
jgi:hypothetical protein